MGGMSFRDFLKSNQALLGKQAWRLLTSSECLWARLMRSKYYTGGSFLEAGLEYNPSYTWRGIVGAWKVVEMGLRKRIGNGADTYIWKDAWITGTHSGRVLSPCFGDPNILKVSELMTENGHAWDEQKLGLYLLPFEHERVRNIRLSTG
ncbi:putative mitochondrial protein AtMg00310 [Silene latifolia]|uniref:putative mitochondrial protein AtMg00310 n=1 Tax=Silene latifolia TaxID=37657 RepID=UPI003D772894